MRTSLFILLGSMSLVSCNGFPKPEFSWFPEQNPEAGDSIQFINESKRADSYRWEFGDGGISSSTNPVYIYRSAGIFDVSLSADNDAGSSMIVRPITIHEPTILGFNVMDSAEIHPLVHAQVWVYDNKEARDSMYTPLYKGITDSIGKVEFRNVEPITYHVWVWLEEEGGSWQYKGYTYVLQRNKVNYYTVPCVWVVS
jgi:PKD repeat protein